MATDMAMDMAIVSQKLKSPGGNARHPEQNEA